MEKKLLWRVVGLDFHFLKNSLTAILGSQLAGGGRGSHSLICIRGNRLCLCRSHAWINRKECVRRGLMIIWGHKSS